MQSASEADSILRWAPGSARGHVESTFLKFSLPKRRQAVWLRFTVLQPLLGRGDPVGEVWGVLFDADKPERNVAVKQTWPQSALSWKYDRFLIQCGPSEIARGRSHGTIERDGHTVAWDLTWTTPERSYRHFPHERMYELPLPRSKALSPAIDARFRGVVTVDGERIEVDEAPGMHGHNWGEHHAEEWVWAHCNAFEQDNVVFEGLSGRIALGPLTTPMLTAVHLATPEHTVTFNSLRDMFSTSSRLHGLYWSFEATGPKWRLRGVAHGQPSRFVGLDYHDPDGTVHHCLGSHVASLELHLMKKNGAVWTVVGTWRTADTCALEIGTRGDTHGVKTLIP